MLSNHVYDMMAQLVQESKTLARIDQYLKDVGDCGDCKAFWEKMRTDKESHVRELTALIKNHWED